MYRILSVSLDARLLFARNNALAGAGFHVISPTTPLRAPKLAVEQEVDAVVLGHSVTPKTRHAIIRRMRELDPCCPIFFVYEHPHAAGEPLADLSINVTGGPQLLLDELTGGRANGGKKRAAVTYLHPPLRELA